MGVVASAAWEAALAAMADMPAALVATEAAAMEAAPMEARAVMMVVVVSAVAAMVRSTISFR